VILKIDETASLTWLESVFHCYNPFEAMNDYKKLFLAVHAKYEYLSTSFVGQYFRADCDVIAVTIATLKVHKKNLQISVFADYLKNWFGDLPFLLHFWIAP